MHAKIRVIKSLILVQKEGNPPFRYSIAYVAKFTMELYLLSSEVSATGGH